MTRFVKWTLATAGLLVMPAGLFSQTPTTTPAQSPAAATTSASPALGEHKNPVERFKRLDKNNDGYITSEEARNPERFKRLLERTDTNPKDGKISKDEFLKSGPGGAHNGGGERAPEREAAAGASPNGGLHGADRVSSEERFQRMDKNNDGFITQDEARDPERFKHLLERADNSPKDGKISKDEFLKAGPSPRGPHGNHGPHGDKEDKGDTSGD